MTYDNPDCFFREEQIWNQVYDHENKVIRVQNKNKGTPTIKVIDISTKDTETTFVFPKGTIAFAIKDRGNSRMKYAFGTGEVSNPSGEYITRGPHVPYREDNLNLMDDFTLYFSSSKDNRKLEIIYWT